MFLKKEALLQCFAKTLFMVKYERQTIIQVQNVGCIVYDKIYQSMFTMLLPDVYTDHKNLDTL